MAATIILFLLFLFFPKITSAGIKNGLQLLFNQVIPALYPFILLTSLLKSKLQKQRHSLPLVISLAILSGYPLGSKIIAQSIDTSDNEKQLLLFLCNNPSPAYMLGFVGFQCLNASKKGFAIYASIFIGNLIWFLLRYLHLKKQEVPYQSPKKLSMCESSCFSMANIIDQTFASLIQISGSILFFSCMASFLTELSFLPQTFQGIFAGFLEMTTGIQILTDSSCPEIFKMIFITGLSSFGGLSVIAQTQSMISDTALSIKKYMADKAIISFIAMSVMYLSSYFFN